MPKQEGFLSPDAKIVIEKLLPEIEEKFRQWSLEYQKPRQLGIKAEFVELHRKLGKLELAIWDGVDTSGWRESPREILLELAAHAFLAINDIDGGEKV